MKATKILALAAIGLAITFLTTTKKGKKIREGLADNADDLMGSLSDLAGKAGNKFSKLQSLIADEVEGLTDDARTKIQDILESSQGAAKSLAKKAKSSLN